MTKDEAYKPEHLPLLLRDQVVTVLRCEAEPHVVDDAERIVMQAADRLEALAQPVVGKDGWLSGYPDYLADPAGLERFRQSVIEASDPHDMAPINFNSLARLIDTIDNLRAALAATPSPVVGDREAIGRAFEIARQVGSMEGRTDAQTYWFGKARDLMNDADAILSLSTPVVGGSADSLVDAATGGRFSNLTAFTEAMLSADDERSLDELVGEAATLLHALAGPLPDPHTMDRAGMAQEVDDG